MLSQHDRAAQAYCATQVQTWRKAAQQLRSVLSTASGTSGIPYRTHRAQCLQEAWLWLAKAREYHVNQ